MSTIVKAVCQHCQRVTTVPAETIASATPPDHVMGIKPLVWEDIGSDFSRAPAPLFGNIRVEKYGALFTTCYSVPGYSNTFAEGSFASADDAKAACEAEYRKRIRAALSAPEAHEAGNDDFDWKGRQLLYRGKSIGSYGANYAYLLGDIIGRPETQEASKQLLLDMAKAWLTSPPAETEAVHEKP